MRAILPIAVALVLAGCDSGGSAVETRDRAGEAAQAAVDAAAEKIKSGELVVHDYMSDNTCPAATF